VRHVILAVRHVFSAALAVSVVRAASLSPPGVAEIVRRSVAVMERNWEAAPEFSFIEHDDETNSGERTCRKSAVIMIDRSPYWMLLAENDKPISADRARQERLHFEREVELRGRQTLAERQKRLSQYEKERKQDNALMIEMADAFRFHLAGEEVLKGHPAYVMEASPKPDYQPKSMETKVLTGMHGRLWIDRDNYQWLKVEAELFRPVVFGLFIAKVQPGTRFVVEFAPVSGSVWLPSRFSMNVNASVLWWRKISSEDETFSTYRPAADSIRVLTLLQQ